MQKRNILTFCFQFVYSFTQYFRHTYYSLTENVDLKAELCYNDIEEKMNGGENNG